MSRQLVTLLCLIGLLAAGCRRESHFVYDLFGGEQPSTITSRDLGRCPFGHAALRDVPIRYGLLRRTPELDARIQNLDVWPGGCVLGSETSKVVCTQCRYAYSTFFKTWEKTADKTNDLSLPVADFVADFPCPPQTVVGKRSYIQGVRDKKVVRDELIYWDSSPLTDIDKAAKAYVGRSGSFENAGSLTEQRHYIRYKAKTDTCYRFVQLMYDKGQSNTCVRAVSSVDKPYGYDQ